MRYSEENCCNAIDCPGLQSENTKSIEVITSTLIHTGFVWRYYSAYEPCRQGQYALLHAGPTEFDQLGESESVKIEHYYQVTKPSHR